MLTVTNTVVSNGFVITPGEFDATLTKLEKISTRASKRGLFGGITVEFQRDTEEIRKNGIILHNPIVRVNIIGERPKFENWEFVARIEYLAGADKPIVSYAGDPEEFHSSIMAMVGTDYTCEHCKVNRYRKFTYIVRNVETNSLMQVGSSCLKDYLGHDILIVWQSDLNPSESDGPSGYIEPTYNPRDIVRIAMMATKQFGFIPTSSEYLSTRDVIGIFLNPRTDEDLKLVDLMTQHHDYANVEFDTVWDTVLNSLARQDSSYADNLTTAMGADYVTSRQLGLLASVPSAYARIVERAQRDKAQAKTQATSTWLGEPGEKISVNATITYLGTAASMYGTSNVVRWIDDSGNIVSTFTTAQWSDNVEVGQNGTLTATIKRLVEFNNSQQTQVTRAKFV